MAKAKRERRTSIRTLPTDQELGALAALERAEDEERARQAAKTKDEGGGEKPAERED